MKITFDEKRAFIFGFVFGVLVLGMCLVWVARNRTMIQPTADGKAYELVVNGNVFIYE